MKCLILNDSKYDFSLVLESTGVKTTYMTQEEAIGADVTQFDSYVIYGSGRLREKLDAEVEKGKRFLTEALGSWGGIYSAPPVETTTQRLVVASEDETIPGLSAGDLLDDESNRMVRPYYLVPGTKILLAYRDHVIAHRHWNAAKEDIMKGSTPGLWTVGGNVMMSSFEFHNYNRARFSPGKAWQDLIRYLAKWITGFEPSFLPEAVIRFRTNENLEAEENFDHCRREAIEHGMRWLERYLVDNGKGGIREGLRHYIDPDGFQTTANDVRTDCSGEASGAFRFYGEITGEKRPVEIADNLSAFVFGPMQVKGGLFDGMVRWTDTAWQVCYQDDVARAILPSLYNCIFFKDTRDFRSVCRALDFLVKTTAKDGCRVTRTDAPNLDENAVNALFNAEHGYRSAHYNAFYHAALLLAYQVNGNNVYLDTARRGLESIMELYPDTVREQSETQELCRLVFPLAVLYKTTGEKKHLDMLYRVTNNLILHSHPSGGFSEWDTGYKAHRSRESRGECSLLTENGDPVADLLYSVNWLPIAFAYAYHVTGDELFRTLWRKTASFCIKSQVLSEDPKTDGSWCRAFDMDLGEAYGCPHDVGWAANCSESGWTNAEILMGLMLPEIAAKSGENK